MGYMEIVKTLSFPRLVGSEGHKKAEKVLSELLNDIGFNFKVQEFPVPSGKMLSLSLSLAAFLVSASYSLLLLRFYWIALIVSTIVLIIGLYSTDISTFFIRSARKNKDSKLKGKNFIIKVGNEKAERTIVLMAHYDSKSQVLPIGIRVALAVLEVFLLLISLIISALALFIDISSYITSEVIIAFIALTLVDGIILSLNKITNDSPGAHDNASGVAFILNLGKKIRDENLLKKSNLEIVITDAEELGLYGAIYWALLRENLERKDKLFIINFDGVGSPGNIYYATRYGIFGNKIREELIRLFKEAARYLGFRLKSSGAVVGASTDAAALNKLGYKVINVSQTNPLKFAFRVHTKRDTPETMVESEFIKLERLILEYIKLLETETEK